MFAWYLDRAFAIAGWLLLAGIVVPAIVPIARVRRDGLQPVSRRGLVWGGALVGESVLHFFAMVIWTDPDATIYGMNWRGLALIALLALALPVAALWVSVHRPSSTPESPAA